MPRSLASVRADPWPAAAPMAMLPRNQRMATARPALGPDADGNAGAAGAGAADAPGGAGPEGLTDDPVLQDLLMGQGTSGGGAGPRPSGAPDKLSPAEASAMLGMGTWRVRPRADPIIQALVAQIEGAWRVILGDDLGLYDLPQRYRYMDSADPGGGRPLAHALPDPPRDDPSWPRLQVENRAYRSRAFRKLHVEVAVRQDGLQVVHCVMYPYPAVDLPILSLDMVLSGGRVTLAIIDPCPVSRDLQLPPFYARSVADLQGRYGMESNRSVPEWGAAIFSPLCVCLRPQAPADVAAFLKYAIALINFHVQIGRLAEPVGAGGGMSEDAAGRKRAEIAAAHERYSARQLDNDKTRRVLEKAFGSGPAEEYMRVVMFDGCGAGSSGDGGGGNGSGGAGGGAP